MVSDWERTMCLVTAMEKQTQMGLWMGLWMVKRRLIQSATDLETEIATRSPMEMPKPRVIEMAREMLSHLQTLMLIQRGLRLQTDFYSGSQKPTSLVKAILIERPMDWQTLSLKGSETHSN